MAGLKGKKVVFTGTFDGYTRKTAEDRATKAGCFVTKAISKKTDYLICGEECGGKVEKAETLGVEVIDQEEWEKLLAGTSTSKSRSNDNDDEDEDEDGDDTDDEAPPAAAAKAPTAQTKVKGTGLKGKKVVFTGTFDGYTRRTAEDRAMKAGCFVTKACSKQTDYLICGEDCGGKVEKAEALGIEVIEQKEWEELLAGTSASRSDDDDENDDETEDEAPPTAAAKAPASKTKLKRSRTHALSDDEDADSSPPTKPALVKRRSLRLSDKVDSAAAASPPAAKKAKVVQPVAGPSRQKCRYWDKCYRKDPNHKKQFRHPPTGGASGAAAQEDEEEEDMEVESGTVAPLHVMKDGETVDVTGGLHGANTFTLKRIGDHYTCTCTGWKAQRTDFDKRTCRHLRAYLGDEYENQRIDFDPDEKPTPSRAQRHKNISVMLAHKWTEATDPKGWWLSEKLDGVRAYWDGKTFFSRLGNEFMAPKWFMKGLPSDVFLDGELFGGRGKFQSTVSIVKTPESSRWKSIKYCVFDMPSIKKEPFEKRIKAMNDLFDNNDIPYAYALEHEKCRGVDHLNEELKRVEALGGEGVMIRKPGSKYEECRSHSLLKYKSFHDAEAIVIGHEKGKGRNASVCGALVCRMACGKEFRVGSGLTDKQRQSPPKKGTIITYRFQELSNSGSPRFPTFVGVRLDLDEPSDAVIPPKPTD